MEWLTDLGIGMLSAIQPAVFVAALLGVIIGVIIGVIPGLGPAVAMSLAIPLTFTLSPAIAISLLLGIYKGGTYGGSISAILINTPGTPAAAATILDGYPLAKQGKAGKALHMALYASICGDAVSIMLLLAVAQPLASIALMFGPPELFSLLLFAMTVIGGLAGESLLRGIISAVMGLMLATVGTDTISGDLRFTFNFLYFEDGFSIIPMIIGLFAIAEVLNQIYHIDDSHTDSLLPPPSCHEDNVVTKKELRSCLPIFLQSSFIGASIGALPGTGSTTAAYLSYGAAKRRSKNPELFGKGNIEGVAAAEAGNNAVCGGALIPMLSLGIPGDVVTAILMGALTVHGIIVGPSVFTDHRAFMFTLFGMLLISIFMLYISGIFAIRFCRKLADLPQSRIMPLVMVLCVLGSYATNMNINDIFLMIVMGCLGFWMNKLSIPIAPMVIAFVLAPKLEQSLRQALILSDGSFIIFLERPISLVFLIISCLSVVQIIRMARKTRKASAQPAD